MNSRLGAVNLSEDSDRCLSIALPTVWRSIRSHSSGRLFDRPWIVIVVVVDGARAMTLGTGDDVAILILDPALAMTLRTDFHAACLVPSRQHRIFETPVPHRQSRGPCVGRVAKHVDQRGVTARVVQTTSRCTPKSRMLPSVIGPGNSAPTFPCDRMKPRNGHAPFSWRSVASKTQRLQFDDCPGTKQRA
jgi:hypothetical protein